MSSALMEKNMNEENLINVSETGKETVVDIKDLNVFYGDFHAVDNVNFSLEKNKVTALIGPSGCGKSTLLIAKEIAYRDNYMDKQYFDLYDKLINIIKEIPYKTENLVPLLFLNRFLERIGDRVTNICECVVYSRTNKHVDLN